MFHFTIPINSLQKAFAVGVYMGEKTFTSDTIQMTDEEISPRSFFQPDEAVLFIDSYTFASIVVPDQSNITADVSVIPTHNHV